MNDRIFYISALPNDNAAPYPRNDSGSEEAEQSGGGDRCDRERLGHACSSNDSALGAEVEGESSSDALFQYEKIGQRARHERGGNDECEEEDGRGAEAESGGLRQRGDDQCGEQGN